MMENLELLLLRPWSSQEVWNKDIVNVVDHPVPGTLPSSTTHHGVPLVHTVQASGGRVSGQPEDGGHQVHTVHQPGVPGDQSLVHWYCLGLL